METGRRWTPLALALLAVGAALRLWQFAADPSLWLDEIALARNIAERGWRELLLSPLDYSQVAPPLFLAAEKALIEVLGSSDAAFRLFPLCASLLALALFGWLAISILGRRDAWLAIALFALAPGLILYGTMVKPYASDVATALLLTGLALHAVRRGLAGGSGLCLAAAGIVAVWLSHPSILVLAGIGLALLWHAGRARDPRVGVRTALTLVTWIAAAAGAVAFARAAVNPATRAYLDAYWSPGFVPPPWRSPEDAVWVWKRLAELVRRGLELTLPDLYVAFFAFGVWAFRRHAAAPYLLLPFLVTLAAAVTRLYPFQGRLLFFLVPALLLTAAIGALAPLRLLRARGRWRAAAHASWIIAAGGAAGTVIAEPPPYRLQPMKELLADVAPDMHPDDAIYVYYGAAHAMRFYGPRFGIPVGEYAEGGCHRGNPRAYLRELDPFRGRPRVWVFITHAAGLSDETGGMRSYLDRIGVALSISVREGLRTHDAEAWLYDLSDPARLRTAQAATHPLSEPRPITPAFGCWLAPQASAEPRPIP